MSRTTVKRSRRGTDGELVLSDTRDPVRETSVTGETKKETMRSYLHSFLTLTTRI